MTTKMATRMAELKGGIPSNLFGDQPKDKAPPSVLAQRRQHIDRGRNVELPGGLGLAYIRLLSHREENRVEAETLEAMENQRIPLHLTETLRRERELRTLVYAVRDPDDHTKPLGTLDDWLDQDADTVVSCYVRYWDVRNALDPIPLESIDEVTRMEIFDDIKKNNLRSLLGRGVYTLSLYMLTGASLPLTSPTAALPGSSPDSSSPPTDSGTAQAMTDPWPGR